MTTREVLPGCDGFCEWQEWGGSKCSHCPFRRPDPREGSAAEGVSPSAPVADPSRAPLGSGPIGSTTAPQGGPDTAAPFKRCSCGQPYTAEQWARLPYLGEQHIPADDEGPAETLELRLCVMCGSTMAVEV